ncbi:MAG: glycosyltransferase [Acidobacteriaceae bacterium]
MRILHVISSLNPAHGGPPEVVCQIARASSQIGVDIEVATLDEPAADYLSGLGFPVHALGAGLSGFDFSLRLRRWLRQNVSRFDGLVMHGIWNWPGVAVHAAAHSSGKPYGIFPHGALDPWFNRKYPLKHLKKLIYWPLQYRVLRDAHRVFFTCESERDLAATSFRPHRWTSEVIQLGASEPSGDPETQIEAWRQRCRELRERRYLLFLGRLHQKKGCDLLLRAFAAAASSTPELHLVMAGPDQLGWQATLQQMAASLGIGDRVHWPGMVTGDAKWGALRAAEAFVLPSHQENFGIVVAESLAVGRPVLISNQVNIWPEVQEEAVGLVDDDTQEGTERLLRHWLELSAAEKEAIAARCYPCYLRRYSPVGTARALRDAFQKA